MEELQVEVFGDRVVLRGELDAAAVPELDRALGSLDSPSAIVDMRAVTFMDSTGLHALLRHRTADRFLRIENVSTTVQRLLEITGTGEHLLGE